GLLGAPPEPDHGALGPARRLVARRAVAPLSPRPWRLRPTAPRSRASGARRSSGALDAAAGAPQLRLVESVLGQAGALRADRSAGPAPAGRARQATELRAAAGARVPSPLL